MTKKFQKYREDLIGKKKVMLKKAIPSISKTTNPADSTNIAQRNKQAWSGVAKKNTGHESNSMENVLLHHVMIRQTRKSSRSFKKKILW